MLRLTTTSFTPCTSLFLGAGLFVATGLLLGSGLFLATNGLAAVAADPHAYMMALGERSYLESVEQSSDEPVTAYLVPLGAIQKVRGVWSARRSERVTGTRDASTWRVLDGYSSGEVVDEVDAQLDLDESASLLFSCDARACGASVQWANRIFRQRLLYGTEVSQRYRVYELDIAEEGEEHSRHLLLIYGSARSADRQYLHMELIAAAGDAQ